MMNLHLGLVQEVLLEQTVQKGCTVTGVNLIEIKKQIAKQTMAPDIKKGAVVCFFNTKDWSGDK